MKKYLVIIGLLLLVGAVIWRFAITPQSGQRFPDGYTWEVNSIGQNGYPDEETGQYTEGTTLADDPISLTFRSVIAEADGAPDGAVLISDYYEVRDPVTNAIIWEFTVEAVVDPETGQHLEGEVAGDYYFLPRNLDRDATYVVSNSSYFSMPMTFQREEEVAGINTYVYGYYEPLDDTVSNADFVELEDGQSVWCFDFSLEYWAEPVTGEIIKYREACEGDWVIDTASGDRLYTVTRWGGETTGDDLARQTALVSSKLNMYQLNNLYLPLILGIVGVLLLAGVFLPNILQTDKDKKVLA